MPGARDVHHSPRRHFFPIEILEIFRMENGQTRNLSEVVLLIEGQNVVDSVILHDHAVNYISDARVIAQNPITHVVEKLSEVVSLSGLTLRKCNLRFPKLSMKSRCSISATSAGSIFFDETRMFTISVTAQIDVQSHTSRAFANTSQRALNHLPLMRFLLIGRIVGNQDVAIEIDGPHLPFGAGTGTYVSLLSKRANSLDRHGLA